MKKNANFYISIKFIIYLLSFISFFFVAGTVRSFYKQAVEESAKYKLLADENYRQEKNEALKILMEIESRAESKKMENKFNNYLTLTFFILTASIIAIGYIDKKVRNAKLDEIKDESVA